MPVKFGKTSKQVDRNTKKVSIVHEYMKTKSNDELIEAYNKDGPAFISLKSDPFLRRSITGLK